MGFEDQLRGRGSALPLSFPDTFAISKEMVGHERGCQETPFVYKTHYLWAGFHANQEYTRSTLDSKVPMTRMLVRT